MHPIRFILSISIFSILSSSLSAFPLISEKHTYITIGKNEFPVVYTALDIFKADMELVSGKKYVVSDHVVNGSILIGTIGQNEYINRLIAEKKVSVDSIIGKWEAFQIQSIKYNEKQLLVVIGSDKRGTAYGILELSRLIGVSPWVWWADSKPDKKTRLVLADDYLNIQQPSVQYRGIFINDEDLGFMPWSTQTLEKAPRKGATGPNAYAKVFELMLRLRANTIWPAMHECTVPFYKVEGNKEMADKYGIVIGTSHCEPLLRNSASEWDKKKYGEYNYVTNSKTLVNFWNERLEEAGQYENLYTIGLRGVHDVGMEGANTLDEKTGILDQVFKDQRMLLKKHVGKDITKIPQVFVPYKEVLPIYENGLKVPDDITLMWCDDNYGYLTRLCTPEEQKRTGGAGIYYHLSYLGRPHQYIWLSSTQPSMVYWQMKQAWNYGARKIWIVNVGDIKPAEYDIEFYLDMAWDINKVNESNIYQVQKKWLQREFGQEFAERLNFIRNEYYRLAHIRRPEFMGWCRQEVTGYKNRRTPVEDSELNPYMFGDEIFTRLKAYDAIAGETKEIGKRIPKAKKEAYFQFIEFPVYASAEMNKKLLYAQKARLYAKYGLPVANEYRTKSNIAFDSIVSLVNYYNKELSGGKWDNMMFREAWGAPVYEKAPLPEIVPTKVNNDILIWPENYSKPITTDKTIKLAPFVHPVGEKMFVSVFTYNGKKPEWRIQKKPTWLDVIDEGLDLSGETRFVFAINPTQLKTEQLHEECTIKINETLYTFELEVKSINKNTPIEYNNMVVIDINKFSGNANRAIPIEGLGYSTKAISLTKGIENAITYKINTTSSGSANIRICMLPNHPVTSEDIRYAISVDNESPKIISIQTDYKNRDEAWKINVLRNQSVTNLEHFFDKSGEHNITIYALDDGIILDQLFVDFLIDRRCYEFPSYIKQITNK